MLSHVVQMFLAKLGVDQASMGARFKKMFTSRVAIALIGAASMPFGAAAAEPWAAPSPECQILNANFSAKDIAGMSSDLLNRYANEAEQCAAYLTKELDELRFRKVFASEKQQDHLKDEPFAVAEPASPAR